MSADEDDEATLQRPPTRGSQSQDDEDDNDDFVEATDEQSTQPSTAHDQTTGKDSTDPTPTPYDTSKELLNGHQDPSQPSVRDALPSSGASDNVDDSEGPSHASQPDSSAPNTNHEAHGSRDSTAPFPQLDGASGPSDHKNAEGPSSDTDLAQKNASKEKASNDAKNTTEHSEESDVPSEDASVTSRNHLKKQSGHVSRPSYPQNVTKQTPSASATEAEPPPAQDTQEPPRRKLTKAFSFFTRNPSNTGKQPAKSSPAPSPRRSRASSGKAEEESGPNDPKKPDRNSLKDRFKLLRMQEEAGVKWIEESEAAEVSDSEIPTKTATVNEMLPHGDKDREASAEARQRAASITANQPTLDEALKPGTAAGTSTGPSEQQPPVDWDLWQAVVYEGPAAVTRTSADELNEAITQGIPSAIRGVVWQVLAQSQNEQLEALYAELRDRSSETVKNDSSRRPSEALLKPVDLKRSSSPAMNGKPVERREANGKDKSNGNSGGKDSRVVSSASSMHSAPSSPTSPKDEDEEDSGPSLHQHTPSTDVEESTVAKRQAEGGNLAKEEAQKLEKLERAIKRDLGARTSYSKFLMSAGLQSGLYGICKAYALYDEEVGYAQGMNFIAMPLLFNMPEEEAFCLFVRLMNQYHLRDMFIHEMPGLHLHLYQFERLLEDLCPSVYCHLHRRGVQPQLYATQWFLTLFAYRFPLQIVLRIYDLILSEGLETAILKFGIVLMLKNADKLLDMRDMAALTTFLKERLFDVYIDKTPSASSVLESGFFGTAGGIDKEIYRADALVQDACAVHITTDMLKQYTTEWEERTRDEKAHQAELDALRAGNTSLASQVRTLQARSEKYDDEHVQIASSLVKTQLHNQTLSEDNESLRTQVGELQGIVSAQPGEVEDRLKGEMERTMQRNIEVQNENRHLEEQLAEMEGEFVKAKVKVAEAEAELEELRRRWASVAGMMSAAGSPRLT